MNGEQQPRRGAALAVALLLVAAGTGGAVKANLWKQDLRVRRIETRGARIVPAAEILGLAGIRKDQRLYALDLPAIRKRIQQNPFVGSVAINREVPDRLVITVAERTPIAAVGGDRLMYLDPEGVVLPPARPELTVDLPIITGALTADKLAPGEKITSEPAAGILALLSAARAVSGELYRRISEIHAEAGRDLVVYMTDGGVPVVFAPENLQDQCLKLDEFWKQFVAERGGSELDYVDLRYEDQVVARWHRSSGPAQQ